MLGRASGTPYSIVRAYSYSGEDEEPLKPIVARGKRGSSTGDLQLLQGDRCALSPCRDNLLRRYEWKLVNWRAPSLPRRLLTFSPTVPLLLFCPISGRVEECDATQFGPVHASDWWFFHCRPEIGGLISRHDLAVVAVEAMEHAPAGNGRTSQGTTFEVRCSALVLVIACDDVVGTKRFPDISRCPAVQVSAASSRPNSICEPQDSDSGDDSVALCR